LIAKAGEMMREDIQARPADTAYDHGNEALARLRALSRTTSRGYRFVFKEGAGPPPHAHPHGQAVFSPAAYLQVVVAGRMWMSSPAYLLWIPPDCPHEVRAAGDREMRGLYVAPRLAKELPLVPVCIRISPLLRELLLRLSDGSEPARADGGAFMNATMAELRRLASGPCADRLSQPAPIGDGRLAPIAAALGADPADGRELADWSRGLGMSTRTLSRAIRAATGLNWREWRLHLRMIDAARRLSAGVSVKAVAYALGYAGPAPFAAAFVRAYGVSPSRYAGSAPINARYPQAPRS
jgi:AraC-like DNA-binding protein/quercetin dioxygenase-like cupin family protein